MFIISFFSGLAILLSLDSVFISLSYIYLILLASILSFTGMYFYNIALKKQCNIGYVEATFSTRIPIIYVLSVLFFNSEIEYLKFIPLIVLICGVLILSDFNPFKNQTNNINGNRWILYAMLASFSTVGMVIVIKIILTKGTSPELLTGWILLLSSFLYLLTNFYKKEKVEANLGTVFFIIVAIIMTAIGNILMFNSYDLAPNLSYVSSLISLRIVLLYIATILFRYDNFDVKKAIAVLICFLSIILF
jgi:uncharacterized membrane protein